MGQRGKACLLGVGVGGKVQSGRLGRVLSAKSLSARGAMCNVQDCACSMVDPICTDLARLQGFAEHLHH